MDPIIFGDVIDQMSQANIIPTHNEIFLKRIIQGKEFIMED